MRRRIPIPHPPGGTPTTRTISTTGSAGTTETTPTRHLSVGVRISPVSPTNGMTDSDPAATFTQAARDLDQLGIAYLHVIEPGVNGTVSEPAGRVAAPLGSGFFRPLFSGAVIAAGGHTAETGTARIRRKEADLIAYGQLFIANPDLPARFARNAPLAQPQRATFYGGGAEGYTDYPSLNGLRRDRG